MWIVIRSLMVYGGTAALLLALLHRFVVPVPGRTALLIALAPLLFTGRAMLTGGIVAPLDIAYQAEPLHSLSAERGITRTWNPLTVDVVSQMLPWRQAVRESLERGRLPLWNPYVLAGEPLLAVQQPAVLHPGTWIGLLLPLPQAWTFDIALRILIGLLCAYAFFKGRGASEPASLLGAAAWAFSDFLIFFVGHPVTPSVAPFPLLLLGLAWLIEAPGRPAVALTVVALAAIVVAGHPETLLFCVAGGGLFFLAELSSAGRGRRARPVLLALLAGALALGLTAVLLLPFAEILPHTWQHTLRKLFYATGERSETPLESLRRLTSSVVPYAWGALGRSVFVGRLIVPAGYAGTLLFPLAAAGLGARSRRRWVYLGLGLAGLAANTRLAGAIDLLVRLPLFDIAVCDYLIFLWIFGLAALAVMGLDELRQGRGAALFTAGAIAATLGVLLVAAVRGGALRELQMTGAYLRLRLLLQVLPLLAVLGIVLGSRRGRGLSSSSVGVGAFLLLFIGQRALEQAEVHPTYPVTAFYPPLRLLDPLPRGEPVRMAGLRYTFAPNIGAMYGVEDVRGYSAMIYGPLAETFGLWCDSMPAFYTRIDRPSAFLSMLGARYVVALRRYPLPPGWSVAAESPGARLFENPAALPRVFVPRHLAWTEDPREHLRIMSGIWDYANDSVAGKTRPGPLAWLDNGEAAVRISSYESDRLGLAIDAKAAAFLATSIPNWPGWKLTIDGRKAPLLFCNRAFVGFEVAAGRHEAVLRYLPDGFVYGSAITLATLLLCAILLGFRARGSTPAR